MLEQLLVPGPQTLETFTVNNGVHQQGYIAVFVVQLGNGFVLLLAGRIPQLHPQVIHLASLGFQVLSVLSFRDRTADFALLALIVESADFVHVGGTQGGLVVGVELVVDVATGDAALTHCHIAQQHYFGRHLFLSLGLGFPLHIL